MSLEARTLRCAKALASSPILAEDVQWREDGQTAEIVCDMPGPVVNTAQEVASARGFVLHGKTEDGKYRFVSRRRGIDDVPGGGLDLPGGAR